MVALSLLRGEGCQALHRPTPPRRCRRGELSGLTSIQVFVAQRAGAPGPRALAAAFGADPTQRARPRQGIALLAFKRAANGPPVRGVHAAAALPAIGVNCEIGKARHGYPLACIAQYVSVREKVMPAATHFNPLATRRSASRNARAAIASSVASARIMRRISSSTTVRS